LQNLSSAVFFNQNLGDCLQGQDRRYGAAGGFTQAQITAMQAKRS
jgi:hypothetical protein